MRELFGRIYKDRPSGAEALVLFGTSELVPFPLVISGVHLQTSGRPSGTGAGLRSYPALKRWAKIGRPSGAER